MPSTLQGPRHVVRPSISPKRVSTQQPPHGSTPRERIKTERGSEGRATAEKVGQARQTKEKKARQNRIKEEDLVEAADDHMDVEIDDADGDDSLAGDSAQVLMQTLERVLDKKRKRTKEEQQQERAKLAKLAKMHSKLKRNVCKLAEEIEEQEARIQQMRNMAREMIEDNVTIEQFICDMATELKAKHKM